MYTRQDYLENKCTHSDYYAQYVDAQVISLVRRCYHSQTLKEAGEHFNGILLVEWDNLTSFLDHSWLDRKMREHGDSYTLAGGACILKEAARQLIEGKR